MSGLEAFIDQEKVHTLSKKSFLVTASSNNLYLVDVNISTGRKIMHPLRADTPAWLKIYQCTSAEIKTDSAFVPLRCKRNAFLFKRSLDRNKCSYSKLK